MTKKPAGDLVAAGIRVEPEHDREVAEQVRVDLEAGGAENGFLILNDSSPPLMGPCPSRRGKSQSEPRGQSSGAAREVAVDYAHQVMG